MGLGTCCCEPLDPRCHLSTFYVDGYQNGFSGFLVDYDAVKGTTFPGRYLSMSVYVYAESRFFDGSVESSYHSWTAVMNRFNGSMDFVAEEGNAGMDIDRGFIRGRPATSGSIVQGDTTITWEFTNSYFHYTATSENGFSEWSVTLSDPYTDAQFELDVKALFDEPLSDYPAGWGSIPKDVSIATSWSYEPPAPLNAIYAPYYEWPIRTGLQAGTIGLKTPVAVNIPQPFPAPPGGFSCVRTPSVPAEHVPVAYSYREKSATNFLYLTKSRFWPTSPSPTIVYCVGRNRHDFFSQFLSTRFDSVYGRRVEQNKPYIDFTPPPYAVGSSPNEDWISPLPYSNTASDAGGAFCGSTANPFP